MSQPRDERIRVSRQYLVQLKQMFEHVSPYEEILKHPTSLVIFTSFMNMLKEHKDIISSMRASNLEDIPPQLANEVWYHLNRYIQFTKMLGERTNMIIM